MNRAADIQIGRATVVQHNDGGWALLGSKVTKSAVEATEAAQIMDVLITANSEKRPGVKAPLPAVVIRREVSGNDATRHTVSV